MEQLPELDPSNIQRLEEYLKKKTLHVNHYRTKVGDGRSQCFGMVRKRSLPPDLSRQSWLDPYLHHLLMEFGRIHVPISFTSIQVNQNYKCEEHTDTHNIGLSYIIGFGDYQGGDLVLDLSGVKTNFNIKYKPLLFDGSSILHSTEEFTGNRFTVVYHKILAPAKFPMVHSLLNYEAVCINQKYVIAVRYPGEEVFYLHSKKGLPHPLKGRKKEKKKIEVPDVTSIFSNPAQNLLYDTLNSNKQISV
jgi:hypothetical protein